MDTIFVSLIIALGVVIATVFIAFLTVHVASKSLVPANAGMAKALAMTLTSFGWSWIVHSFFQQITGTFQLDFSSNNPTRFIAKIAATIAGGAIGMLGTWLVAGKMYGTQPKTTLKITAGVLVILSISTVASVWRLVDWWFHTPRLQ
jgi:hypothetical protein